MNSNAATRSSGETLIHAKSRSGSFAKRMLWPLLGFVLVLITAHLTLQYLNLEVFGEKHGMVFELSNRFDFDDESSVPTWFSQATFLVLGAVAFTAAYMASKSQVRNLWKFIGTVSIIVSLDEILTLHETLLQGVHTKYFGEAAPQTYANAWLFVIPLVVAAGIAVLIWMTKVLPARTLWIFVAGAVLYLAGAIGIDLITNAAAKDTFLSQGILVALEESAEMFGGVLFLYASVDYLEVHHGARLRSAFTALRPR